MVETNRPPEANLENKIIKYITKEMLHEIRKARREYQIAYTNEIEIASREEDRVRGFITWFMLKYTLKEELTAYEWSLLRWKERFSEQEIVMIRNALNYVESFFEIVKISENKKEYVLKDLKDELRYTIQTIDLQPVFKEGDIVQTIVMPRLAGDYFFRGNIVSYTKNNKIQKWLIKLREITSKKDNEQPWFTIPGKTKVKDKSKLLEAQHEMVETMKEYFSTNVIKCKNAIELKEKLDEFYEWRNKKWIVPGMNKTPEQLWKEANVDSAPKMQSPSIRTSSDKEENVAIIADTHHGIAVVPFYKELETFFQDDYKEIPGYAGFLYNIIVGKKSPIQTFLIKRFVMQNEERALQIIKKGYKNIDTIEDMIDLFISERNDWSDSPFNPTITLLEDV